MKKKAFTLIELMGVLTIIGILALILIPVVNNMVQDSKDDVYNKQLESIKLSAKNLVSDNPYILPVENEVIYITLGQLRTLGYAEETIINPLTNENFSDDLLVTIIKTEKDYDYLIDLNSGNINSSSGITVSNPSKSYIKKDVKSSYIITAKITNVIDDKETDYYINIDKDNIKLKGEAFDTDVKYKVDGDNGLYKLTLLGGEKEGSLYFNFENLKSIDGSSVDVSTINNNMDNVNNNKQIIVDNTAPTCSWTGENTTWTKNAVTVTVSGSDSGSGMKTGQNTNTWSYTTNNQEMTTDSLSYTISDNAGNTTTCSKTVNVYHDTKDPTINNVTEGNCSGNTRTITVNASDISGISGYAITTRNTVPTSYTTSSSTPWISSAQSIDTYYAWVKDKAGNVSSESISLSSCDTTAPTITFGTNGSGSNWVSQASTTVTVTDNDNGSGVESIKYGWSSEATSTTTTKSTESGTNLTFTPDADEDGDYYLYVEACDKAGNCATKTSNAFKLDVTSPTLTITNPSNENWTNKDVTITLDVKEESSGISNDGYYTEGTTLATYNWKNNGWTISNNKISKTYSNEINKTASFQVCDKVGNCSNISKTTIKIDKTAPTCGSVTGSSTTWSSDSRTITQTCTDTQSKCVQSSYTKTYQPTKTTTTDTISIYDNAGNSKECTYNVYVTPIIINGNINNWVCGKCRTDKTYTGIKNYCALDDNNNCIETADERYGNTVGKVEYTISDNKVTFNWEIRQGKATYIDRGYWVKFIIKDTSNNSVVKEFYLKEATGTGWYEGTKHTGTVEYSFTNKGTYKIYIDGNSGNPSFDMDFGTITVK